MKAGKGIWTKEQRIAQAVRLSRPQTRELIRVAAIEREANPEHQKKMAGIRAQRRLKIVDRDIQRLMDERQRLLERIGAQG